MLFAILILFTDHVLATAPVMERVEPLTIPQKIVKYANEYNVSAEVMSNVINCESSMNPKAINHTSNEYSVGLSQINLNVHNVSVEQAMDEDFAIEFMAKNIGKSPRMWTCWTNIYG